MSTKTLLTVAVGVALATGSMTVAVADTGPTQPVASDPDQAIKCRRVEVTGSLVKKGKVCKTVAEWKRIVDNGNRTARAIQDSGKICSGGECGNGN